MIPSPPIGRGALPVRECLWSLIALGAFLVAQLAPSCAPLVVVYVFALIQLARGKTWRRAFYPGLCVGVAIGAVHLTFFWTIFSGGAAALWLVFAVWLGLFAAASQVCLRTFGSRGWFLVPFLWMGFEYFRSELYPLKFAWLSPGYTFSGGDAQAWVGWFGVYGIGLVIAALATVAAALPTSRKGISASVLMSGMVLLGLPSLIPMAGPEVPKGRTVRVAGLQLEFPTEREVIAQLGGLMRHHPEIELIVLPEYTLGEEPSAALKSWCRTNRVHLIVGGKQPAPGNNFLNTAYVISPDGEVIFGQVKSVPIQFFKDGLPATEQRLWASPWGDIGICICYDLSYTRVTDRLAQMGAQALIVPTMDVTDWGQRQHELHARIAPARAREYGIPVFRIASSGISQNINSLGKQIGSAPFPGQGSILLGELVLGQKARLPLDRFLVGFTPWLGVVVGWAILKGFLGRSQKPPSPQDSPAPSPLP